jgi:hypothetical protein
MSSPAEAAREHVEKIRHERYYIGRGEQNPLSEDMHQAVNYLSQELYSKDVHFLMEIIQVKNLAFLHMISFLFLCHTHPLSLLGSSTKSMVYEVYLPLLPFRF